MGTQVLIVSEIRFFREGLAASLRDTGELGVLDAVAPAVALRAVEECGPDVVLLHVSAPPGPQIARRIAVLDPHIHKIALGVAEDEDSIVGWAEAGVAGYVPSDGSLAQVVEAIRVVVAGGAACTPRAAAALLHRLARFAPSPAETTLTSREIEVARLIEGGLSNKEIGRALSVSLPTVKNHVHHILHKLQVGKRSEIHIGDSYRRRIQTESGSVDPL